MRDSDCQLHLPKKALETAKKVLEWSSDSDQNKITWEDFAARLVSTLNTCFDGVTDTKKFRKRRERMWCHYHKARSSLLFRECWVEFFDMAGCEAMPVFYQFVTDSLFEQLIKLRYPIVVESTDKEVNLNFEEQSAVCYMAGYTIRSLLNKFKRLQSKQNDEPKECLQEVIEDADVSMHESTKWTKSVDRERLIHISDPLFCVFAEIVLWSNLSQEPQDLSEVVELIVNDEKVLFHGRSQQ